MAWTRRNCLQILRKVLRVDRRKFLKCLGAGISATLLKSLIIAESKKKTQIFLKSGYKYLLVDCSKNPVEVFLPKPELYKTFMIKDRLGKSSINPITISFVDNDSMIINTNYSSVFLISDGKGWFLY